MPRLALSDEDGNVNAFTYGFSAAEARVIVTQGFLDHLQPADEELDAVLAHEMGHVRHGDFIINTLLRFPIWLMDKSRWLLQVFLFIARIGLRVIREIEFGWIGLMMLLMALAVVLYLSAGIGLITVAIFLCVVALNAFGREREFLADRFAADLLGTPEPLQSGLAKLEVATERIRAIREERVQQAAEGEEIHTHSDPEAPSAAGEILDVALAQPPEFWSSVAAGEWLETHPSTHRRIYFLANPDARMRPLTAVLQALGEWLNSFLLRGIPQAVRWREAVVLGAGTGTVLALGGKQWAPWYPDWAGSIVELVIMLAGGIWLAERSRRFCWDGMTFLRQIILTAYVAMTVFLVLGTVCATELTWTFWAMFPAMVVEYGTVAVAALWVRRRLCGRAVSVAESPPASSGQPGNS